MRMKVKNVHKVKSKGRDYYYHRLTRQKLTAEPGTAAFFQQIAEQDKIVEGRRPVDGSFGGLIDAYHLSPEFRALAPRTQRDYDRVLYWLKKGGDIPTSALDAAAIVKLREKAFDAHGFRFANYVLAVSSVMFNWGKSRELADGLGKDIPR